ncbi:short-chain dehydrogenase TIC 32, chloroplastic-like isoform X1 [Tripterygium wilfordii]|uniref:short-chain dehydrogenase TIC 32, chloroplastic-like isoform X1 n=1 Tax=Tripterygium wilfordii TaxID=458696 RepID=UPI0018F7EF53|nr:short-chain dehydrogenase TIC 32, chloroplastic-like isoform X1 [Tripterygium wilfordii]
MWIFGVKGPSGFSASSTAEEVTQGIDGTGLTAIVTGASSGIGEETTRILALRGVHVVMAVRNVEAGRNVRETILKENPSAKIDVMELDLSSMASARKFASEYNSSGLPLNLLINNAGIMATPFMLSEDGIELQFATNHLGHFLLTSLLLETMKNTARQSNREVRIINVSSMAHRWTYSEGIQFDEISSEPSYNTTLAYGQSKLSNILHTNELARCLKLKLRTGSRNVTPISDAKIGGVPHSLHSYRKVTVTNIQFLEDGVDVTANSLHPGAVGTKILRHNSFLNGVGNVIGIFLRYLVKNVQQGAATTCYVALHPQVKGVSGEYFSDSNIAQPSVKAKDAALAKKLWDFSLSLTTPK